ncbi:Ca-activated chloride channel family protein [Arsukibacterium tuosuense]|uniref:Ca-activated chloride channel family protein n=1 Tax=Arsukibacterium tuosuense TaxID=1323745 RepID=A0A285IU43_9GAMM|nr:VWA domain-containing protein [Arsukibacterium tuosuense]SNY51508.1 Ca-activated chloride channel family protein [Arsukibacterium tuosuense]
MNLLADFHLLRPWWLLALLPAVMLWLLILNYRQQTSAWQRVIAPHLQQLMLSGNLLLKRNPLALPVLLICWLLSVLALAGPTWQKQPQPAFTLNKATVLIVDMSMSMRATDMSPDRVTQQRFKALDFIDELAEGELALLSFAGDAFVISPLTPDFNNVRLLLNELKPELMPVQGSNIEAALDQADDLLRQAGHSQGDIVLFTDGFASADYSRIMQRLDNWPHRLSVLAFGTDQGAPVQLESGQLLKDSRGAVVIPKVPLSQLATLARKGRGSFAAAGTGDGDIEGLLANINSQFQQQAEQSEQFAGDLWQDNAVYLVWLLLPLALYLAKRAPVLVLLPFCYIPTSEASVWRDLWQTPAQQAITDYQQQDYQNARQKFNDPLWQGNAAYRQGDYVAAAEAFNRAAEQQPSADAFANLGNSLAMQQKYEQALASYQQALALDPEHQQAKQNAELLEQLQQQQQQQDGEQQDGEQQDGEQQDGEQQSADGSDSSAESEGSGEDQGQSEAGQNEPTDQPTEQNSAAEQQNPEQTEPSQSEQQAATAAQQEQQELSDNEMQQAIREMWPNANQEEQQQLDNLLRKVQDDPGLLLRNRMNLEYQKRRQYALPKGAEQEW